jgi:hypothetical protein
MPTIQEREAKLADLFRQWQRACSAKDRENSAHTFQLYITELEKHPRFVASKAQRAERLKRLRDRVVPLELQSEFDKWDRAKNAARNNVLKLLSEKNGDKRVFTNCGHEIHIAACRYAQHKSGFVIKPSKTKGYRLREAEPEKTAVECLKRLRNSLRLSDYMLMRAWVAMSPTAREALVRGNPGKAVPLSREPTRQQIEPLLAGAIRFAGRPGAPSQETRDNLIVAIMLAYGKITGKPPTLSRSHRNATTLFLESVEEAYENLLPGGFNIPWGSHSKLNQLRLRALKLLACKN